MTTPTAPNLSRRYVLRALASLAALPLANCGSYTTRAPVPVCPDSSAVSDLAAPLTIDAHAHVFNGTDLQIGDFISEVLFYDPGTWGKVIKFAGSLIQEVDWTSAPDGSREMAALGQIAQALQNCDTGQAQQLLDGMRQSAYAVGRAQLQSALRASPDYPALQEHAQAQSAGGFADPSLLQVAQYIDALPKSVVDYRAPQQMQKRAQSLSSVADMAARYIDFALQNFQYRYVSVHDYLHLYNQPGTRVVDLLVPSMVDYDFGLAMGQPTRTPFKTQIEVMRRIAVLTRGRVHCFAPFCPMREVAYSLGIGQTFSSLALVKDAVENNGCLGVKLYPPMGFAALGNEQLRPSKGHSSFWDQPWLPDWMTRPDMGRLLDDAMRQLLGWCETNGVPVMAHTGPSNGVIDAFMHLTDPQYWQLVLNEFPRLRVNFGHFGDTHPVVDGIARARQFASLMTAEPGAPGSNAYADAAYFVEVTTTEPTMLANLQTLYEETAEKGQAALANRLLYGTDWEFTIIESGISTYLSGFEQLFDGLAQGPLVRMQGISSLMPKFFALNAVNYLGLRKGDPARIRLDAFYANNSVPTPDWMTKVDALPA
jgi:predicted TIM-barrel fold metal-dependent hydrolase